MEVRRRTGVAAAERTRRGRPRRLTRRARLVLLGGAHLFVLSAFAVAQPLFDLLSRNAEFFAVRGSTRADLVAFALGALLVPPAVLLLLEFAALALGVLAWRAVHLAFVALLSGLVVLLVFQRLVDAGVVLLVLAALAGAGAAAGYLLAPPVRTFLTILVPAPLVLAGVFLFHSPVSRLLAVEETAAATAPEVNARTPVVLIVFDELGTAALLDGRGRLDAKRFPSFGRLARDATFYRDATTVHGWTERAVPAILTGRLPEPDDLPVLADHPLNLFTLLGGAYRIWAHETHTRLCPKRYCTRSGGAGGAFAVDAGPAGGASLASDVTVVYLHVLLPDSLAARLPRIDRSWRDFRGGALAAPEAKAAEERCFPVCRLVRNLDSVGPSSLHFFHAATPHTPWRQLPSGKTYLGDVQEIPGLRDSVWESDERLIEQAHARYLLQVGATDRALGLVLDRLRERRLYDRSLIVVASDHGVSFASGRPRRNPTPDTLDDIAFVPLFVKLPGQRRGAVRPGHARTVDIVPTIADALDVQIPWEVDGRSLLPGRLPREAAVDVMGAQGYAVSRPLAELRAERRADLARQAARFGSGGWARVHAPGPLGRHAGATVESLPLLPSGELALDLDLAPLYAKVDTASQLVPALVTGRVAGGAPGTDLLVAVNGRVVATARTYGADARFAAVAPDDAFRPGRNAVDVLVPRGGGFERLRPREPELRLDGDALVRTGAGEVPLDLEIRGEVSVTRRAERVDFAGWAADLDRLAPVDAIAVFVGGRLLYTASGRAFRRERPAEAEGIEGVGFGFALPESSLPRAGGETPVRVFALSDDRAAELGYAAGYPWRT